MSINGRKMGRLLHKFAIKVNYGHYIDKARMLGSFSVLEFILPSIRKIRHAGGIQACTNRCAVVTKINRNYAATLRVGNVLFLQKDVI